MCKLAVLSALPECATPSPKTSPRSSSPPPAPASPEPITLPSPPPLEGVKSKKATVLSLHRLAGGVRGAALDLTRETRVSVAGLDASGVDALCTELLETGTKSEEAAEKEAAFQVVSKGGLRISMVPVRGDIDAAFDAVARATPHVLIVRLSGAGASRRAAAAIRNFKGAVVALEETGLSEIPCANFMQQLGLKTRFAIGPDATEGLPGFISVPLAKFPTGRMIPDLALKHLQSEEYAALVAAADGPHNHHFHYDFLDEGQFEWNRARCAMLVDTEDPNRLLGVIVYKYWAAPLRVCSILRVLVMEEFQGAGYGKELMKWVMDEARQKPRSECGSITLNATPGAIPFYERLNFLPMPERELEEADEDDMEPLEGALWMKYKLGRAYKPAGRR